MLIVLRLHGSEENKTKQVMAVSRAAMLLATYEPFDTITLEDISFKAGTLSHTNTIIHDGGGSEWDNLPHMAAVNRVVGMPFRPASIDVLIVSKALPKKVRHVANAIITIDVDDDDEMHHQLEFLSALGKTLKDARRYTSLINLGTMRQIGSAGFNGREHIKNDHYYHMTFDMWSTGYEGAYTSDYATNAEQFNTYTDALINNYRNGMDGRTE